MIRLIRRLLGWQAEQEHPAIAANKAAIERAQRVVREDRVAEQFRRTEELIKGRPRVP